MKCFQNTVNVQLVGCFQVWRTHEYERQLNLSVSTSSNSAKVREEFQILREFSLLIQETRNILLGIILNMVYFPAYYLLFICVYIYLHIDM